MKGVLIDTPHAHALAVSNMLTPTLVTRVLPFSATSRSNWDPLVAVTAQRKSPRQDLSENRVFQPIFDGKSVYFPTHCCLLSGATLLRRKRALSGHRWQISGNLRAYFRCAKDVGNWSPIELNSPIII